MEAAQAERCKIYANYDSDGIVTLIRQYVLQYFVGPVQQEKNGRRQVKMQILRYEV